jgi:hypothetical protein
VNDIPETPRYATDAPRKSRKGWWIGGAFIAAALLLGMCVKGGIDVYGAIKARGEATVEAASQFMRDGLPPEGDPIYSQRASIIQPAVDQLNELIAVYGPGSKFEEPTCGMVSKANTDAAQPGTFSQCTVTAQTRRSTANISMQWVREDGAWKVLSFHVNYSNDDPWLEYEAAATEDAEPAEAAPE